MTMNENANMAELFRSIGWTDEQIVDFLLGVEGRISIDEAARRIKQSSENNNDARVKSPSPEQLR